ncbi:hypothetical protein OEZ86_002067 [Tetradesmus obliquus]|nr:hypothetical protein OEZ86_002067 [Tetradesmus obliquus]
MNLNRQSPALQTPLPELKPPVGARGQDIMIIWDFQNVRTPTELEPTEVIRFLYNTFVVQPGPRRCAGAFCTFTDSTKKAVGEKRFNQFCSNGVLNFMMINSPGGPRKADDSDHPLKEMMMNFTVDCVRGHKDGVLLLITADADFVRPANWCKQQGCVALELLYYGPIASKDIKELDAAWKMEWRDFLDASVGRRCAWTFPYPQDVAAGLVPQSNSSNSGTGGYYSSSPGSSNYADRDGRYREQQQQQQQQQLAAAAAAAAGQQQPEQQQPEQQQPEQQQPEQQQPEQQQQQQQEDDYLIDEETGEDGVQQPLEPYEVQQESEPEPPSPGSYVPLDASEGADSADSAGDECSSRQQMLSHDAGGEHVAGGFSDGMGEGLGFGEGGEGLGQGSVSDDFVEKLVRRVSGGPLPAGLDLNLGLGLDLGDSSAAAAAAAATSGQQQAMLCLVGVG